MDTRETVEKVKLYQEAKKVNDIKVCRQLSSDILKANKGLIIRFARRYGREVEAEDAEQACSLGMLRALDDFDPGKSTFSSYVGWWARDHVQRFSGRPTSINRPRTSTMPGAIKKKMAIFRTQHGREANATELGVTETQLNEWLEGLHYDSLDDFDNEGPKRELATDISEENHRGDSIDMREAYKVATDGMSDRNRDIVMAVFYDKRTEEEVAEEYGLARQRIQQVCKRFETRMRNRLLGKNQAIEDRKEKQVQAVKLSAKRHARSAA